MDSKEALEKISWRYVNDPSFQEWCNTIKQDLDKLENLEKYIIRLKRKIKRLEEQLNDIYDEYDECDMSKAEYWL